MINRAGNFFLLLNSLLTIHRFIASRLANIDILKNCANKSAVDFVQKNGASKECKYNCRVAIFLFVERLNV